MEVGGGEERERRTVQRETGDRISDQYLLKAQENPIAARSNCNLVSWCFEPSQPVGMISGQKTNFNPSLSRSADKLFNSNHNTSTLIACGNDSSTETILERAIKSTCFCCAHGREPTKGSNNARLTSHA